MSVGVLPPLPVVTLEPDATRTGFRLPVGVRLRARRTGQPFVVKAEGATGRVGLSILGPSGDLLDRVSVATGHLCGLWLPRGSAHLLAEGPAGEAVRLSYSPLGRGYHLWRALTGARSLHEAAGALRTAKRMRRRLKQVLWASPAATPLGLPTYRRFRHCHVGNFAQIVAPDAAPRLHFVSQAADVPLKRLSACAAALKQQTDRQFDWYVGVPAARLAREGAAIRNLLRDAVLVETDDDEPMACLAKALGLPAEGLIAPLDAEGMPTRDAVALIRAAFAAHPDCELLYTDEEYVDSRDRPVDVAFKPAFNRHLLQAMNYVGHLTVLPAPAVRALGLQAEFGAAALYDLFLRHAASVENARILHVPRVAYSGRANGSGFADDETARLAAAALSRHLALPVTLSGGGRHLRALYPVPQPAPLVSIVIPTRDRAGLLRATVETLLEHTAYTHYELIIIDNGSTEPATLALFEEIAARWPATRVVRDDGDFNFSRLCNAGIAAARGDLILLLNNDMEVIEPGWLTEMVALASLPKTGIVGAKLLYPDWSLQHGGFIIGLRSGTGSHWFSHAPADAPGYQERLLVRQNLSAVTGACLMIRRDCLDAAGLLDETQFPEECNDVDLCLRARRAGYDVVFTPFACLLHHESATRGIEDASRPSSRRLTERARFERIWSVSTRTDPHFSPNLERDNEFALRAPAPRGALDPRTDAI
ncbi:glycosyltransferase family 2 protein [Ancylobacter sp. A5.8]|uniref:glycosyltransferase family 2 protein n=1 Tax=Ancylobacter gelatini TaxID=2919920 RepID=UPI001F4D9B7A|nr:glycosyltransferase family 2 protein [Ancylobacter gelatini]MCJ8142804.1 glycosyltransferase family 2 protein [Ancylobacter gelatini]